MNFNFVIILGVRGLIDVSIRVPTAVAENSTVNMTCLYDLGELPLYSVKWYKGSKEFYRYIPKELPPMKVFPQLGAKVDVNRSSAHSVIIKEVQMDLSGKYRCEVSTDAPTFYTKYEFGHLQVARLPKGNLTVRMEKRRYAVGDTVRGNCTAPAGSPPANITWTVNGLPINASHITNKYVSRNRTADSRQQTIATLDYEIIPDSFNSGRLHIACHAVVFHLYKEYAEIVLEEERPRLAPVLGTRESNNGSAASQREEWAYVMLIVGLLSSGLR
ncbi:uncharacterized protein LOC117171339 isoform X2 [Belonocnema kinseyi]|uniref:uncharacterized protein LOC117171339 isoform X2 n=1 Tax=Belonocnema kinseyi TaxID=2817044 RepID=UPI00143DEFC4|nr:uncharacterized protein LOC117171339 isoform X2 [Belonocnema kinseyi]